MPFYEIFVRFSWKLYKIKEIYFSFLSSMKSFSYLKKVPQLMKISIHLWSPYIFFTIDLETTQEKEIL